jgi:hypothetical protein
MILEGGAQMRDITLPEVKLPDFKLPDGLRDMTKDDIVQVAHDARVRGMELQKKIEMPDIDLSKVDLSKVELPKQISDRLPRRRRTNPLLPIAGIMAIGATIAGIWWLFTSSMTGPRVRSAVNDLKQHVTGESNDLVRYDNDDDLGSLLADAGEGRKSMGSTPYTSTNGIDPLTAGSPVGPGVQPESVGQTAY